MNFKSLIILAFSLIGIMVVYFIINPSYEKSLEAKYYYEVGEYSVAYEKAQEAFSLDQYNRMASTIMAQSKIAMKYEAYIDQAKEYMQEIKDIVSQEYISDADKAKIKMMSEIVVDSYAKLAPSVITDAALVMEAKEYHDSFEKLLEKVKN